MGFKAVYIPVKFLHFCCFSNVFFTQKVLNVIKAGFHRSWLIYTAAFTYYYGPVILRNKLTPLSIFRDIALR